MKLRWCWKCEAKMPFLEEDEWARFEPLLRSTVSGIKRSARDTGLAPESQDVQAQWGPVFDSFETLTGFRATAGDSLWHHRLAELGPECGSCGHPLRTPKANQCADCGASA